MLNNMKKKDVFVSIIKGIITGIASLVPGVSTAAVLLSVSSYDNFTESLHNIAKKDNKVVLFVTVPLVIGLLLGLIGGVHLIDYFWNKFRIQTILLFVGLVLGGIRVIFVKEKLKFSKKIMFLFIVIGALFGILYYLLKDMTIIDKVDSMTNLIFLGLITGLTILVPGLSLITLKLKENYNYIIELIRHFTNISNIVSILVFIIMFVITIFIVSKTIYKLISRNRRVTYIVLCSLMFASIIISLFQINKVTFNFVTIFTSILAFLWGFIFAKNVERE